jgi:hypothetical protein
MLMINMLRRKRAVLEPLGVAGRMKETIHCSTGI